MTGQDFGEYRLQILDALKRNAESDERLESKIDALTTSINSLSTRIALLEDKDIPSRLYQLETRVGSVEQEQKVNKAKLTGIVFALTSAFNAALYWVGKHF